ncbi:MAG: alpha/beta fold hydrolase [Saprospiraceae bacterium]|nr:alpha/beta fold hydrolase [Saprospiraceae bacterium]
MKRTLIMLLVFGFIWNQASVGCTIFPPENFPKGVYKMSDGSYAVLVEMNGFPGVIFSNGTVRVLKPSASANEFEFGNAIALFDSIEGRIRIEDKGEKIFIKSNGVEAIGTKLKLKEQDKEFKNGNLKLAGTLILPEGKGPFPCLVMTHGSGYEKREASRGLAYLFASNGIAVFIYDKRGTDKPEEEGEWKASFADYANDAIAAAMMLAKYKSINAKHIGIFGHSQGGWVAPLAASKSDLFAYAIISAGNVVTPVEQHLYNGMCANRQAGVPEWAIKEIYDFRVIKYEAGITGNKEKFEAALPIAQKKVWFVRTGGELPGGTFWTLNGYYKSDTALSALKCPILVIGGELDRYTDTKTNMALFQQIFEKSGNIKNVTFKVFPSANHGYFETSTGKLDETEMPALKKFADGYFDTLINWTLKITKQ